ncbi:oligosaccharide biosynthesis protein Alg14 like-domain-containing protein [Dissophora ornata]|nr:oligosaccharide biosynthesis protein Alg14 like-domain-containing protein [Dissophora ornata]
MDLHDVYNLALASVITAVLIAIPLALVAAIRLYVALPQHRRSTKTRTVSFSTTSNTKTSTSSSLPLGDEDSKLKSRAQKNSTLNREASLIPARRCTTTIFLGSGGHTAEMLQLVSGLDTTKYSPRHYVVGWDDSSSVEKVQQLEATRNQRDVTATFQRRHETQTGSEEGDLNGYTIHRIPRSRYVHQSMLTTPFTLAKSLLVAMPLIKRLTCLSKASVSQAQSRSSTSTLEIDMVQRRSVLLMNGPGTCFALALAVIGARMLGVPDEQTPDLAFVESFARVKTLSLAGRLLYPLCDVFLVQWPGLAEKYPRAEYIGTLV